MIAMADLPITPENEPAPLPISGRDSQRHVETTTSLDPQQATTYAEFIRAMRQVDNDRVNEVYKRYPVNVNVQRDERRHEVDIDFMSRQAFEDEGAAMIPTERAAAAVNRQTFERWHTDYWSEIDSE